MILTEIFNFNQLYDRHSSLMNILSIVHCALIIHALDIDHAYHSRSPEKLPEAICNSYHLHTLWLVEKDFTRLVKYFIEE